MNLISRALLGRVLIHVVNCYRYHYSRDSHYILILSKYARVSSSFRSLTLIILQRSLSLHRTHHYPSFLALFGPPNKCNVLLDPSVDTSSLVLIANSIKSLRVNNTILPIFIHFFPLLRSLHLTLSADLCLLFLLQINDNSPPITSLHLSLTSSRSKIHHVSLNLSPCLFSLYSFTLENGPFVHVNVSSLVSLTSLALLSCPMLLTIDGLTLLDSLSSFSVVDCFNLKIPKQFVSSRCLSYLYLDSSSFSSMESILTSEKLVTCLRDLTVKEPTSSLSGMFLSKLATLKIDSFTEKSLILPVLDNLEVLFLSGQVIEDVTITYTPKLIKLVFAELPLLSTVYSSNLSTLAFLILKEVPVNICLSLINSCTALYGILYNCGALIYDNSEVLRQERTNYSLALPCCTRLSQLCLQRDRVVYCSLPSCPKLKELVLLDLRVDDVSGLDRFPSLESLSVKNCRRLFSIEGTDSLINLQSLVIHDCPSLSNLCFLNFCSNISFFKLTSCRQLDVFSFIAVLHELQTLVLETSYSKDLVILCHLPRLRLVVVDFDVCSNVEVKSCLADLSVISKCNSSLVLKYSVHNNMEALNEEVE
ncbi:hypothetical protein RCL1_006264 [Eukaryota sp. TZLM3-RCL]